MKLRTCVSPSGSFVYGVHDPSFRVENFRENDYIDSIGKTDDGRVRENRVNFPTGLVDVDRADTIYEIPNAFPFKGTTYIARSWAEAKAVNPDAIRLPKRKAQSLSKAVDKWLENSGSEGTDDFFEHLPETLQIALAASSTDPEDLIRLADICCGLARDPATGHPTGMLFKTDGHGRTRPDIKNHALFETLANNRFLPDEYKKAMVLKPGVQGGSEIVGEYLGGSHVFEYLRRNSYIPWGHYAANMADDAVRYRIGDLTPDDMTGMRHLYYQRTFAVMAGMLGIELPDTGRTLSVEELEELRVRTNDACSSQKPEFDSSLWGWNFGYDYAPTGYRLHASHQQIHQQFALLPSSVPTGDASEKETFRPFACGDLVADFIREYKKETGKNFFETYIRAIRGNRRMDGDVNRDGSLAVHEDGAVILFVPKAQTSQWELQLMTLKPVGNVLEADIETRRSLDRAILTAMKTLTALGAEMITTIEYSKRFGADDADQRLLYSFLPKLPESPGGFSEAQLRWINGHFPEDFAAACRAAKSE